MDTSSMAKSPPLDLSHHFSEVTKQRIASQMKGFYKYFQIPGIGNLAGGLPNVQYFPFDTLEAQAAKPERWNPTPNQPGIEAVTARMANAALGDVRAASHVTVPKQITQADPLQKIDLSSALQYGTAEGYPPLRSFIRQFSREVLHPNVPYAGGPEVILTCGSTDGMSKSLELVVNAWTPSQGDPTQREGLLCEVFMYGNVLTQVAAKGMHICPVEIDDEGMLASGPGGLEDVLANWDESLGKRPRLMYTVTMGHNPTSGVLSVERRREIYALCSEYDVIIVEDDPYWYLQYPSADIEEAISRNQPAKVRSAYKPPKSSGFPFIDSLTPSYLSIDTDGRVIRLDTFSKTIAPGCRLGWITAQPALVERIMRITETSTQQPSGFVQSMVAEVIMGAQPPLATSTFRSLSPSAQLTFTGWQLSGWVRWLAGLRGEYEHRMNRMSTILDEGSVQLKQSTPVRPADQEWGVITKTQLFSFDWPRGGMFLWLRMNFEAHPLWLAPGKTLPLIDGVKLSTALMIFCSLKPNLIVVAPGLLFSATEAVRVTRGWAYFRLCFAAESDENIERCSERFVAAVQKFWRIKDVEEIEDLVARLDAAETAEPVEGMGNLSTWVGC